MVLFSVLLYYFGFVNFRKKMCCHTNG